MLEDTLIGLIVKNATEMPDEVAMREKRFGVWKPMTWREFKANVQHFALGLRALGFEDGKHWVVYRENAQSIQIDLSGSAGPLPAVAVDTTKEYREIDLGLLKPRLQRIGLPRESDWAIAIGKFK